MSETKADTALTVMEIQRKCDALRAIIGESASVVFMVDSRPIARDGACLLVDVMPGSKGQFFLGTDYDAPFAQAEAWALTNAAVARNSVIRRMALAIIEITDEHGACTVARLVGKGFAPAEIETHRASACARASEMAGNAPFEVVS